MAQEAHGSMMQHSYDFTDANPEHSVGRTFQMRGDDELLQGQKGVMRSGSTVAPVSASSPVGPDTDAEARRIQMRLCGISADVRALDVDHILPKGAGGTDDPENLQALCWFCQHEQRSG